MVFHLELCILLAMSTLAVAQYLNAIPRQYCTDLRPKNDIVNMKEVSGTWLGYRVITHDERMISGNRYDRSCIYVVITEISHEVSTAIVNPQPIPDGLRDVTQFGPIKGPPNPQTIYRFLRLEWTQNDERLEYILRYNNTRRGFWISAPPQQYSPFDNRPQANFGHFTGTVQVLIAEREYMLITICESQPKMRLFSVILTRRRSLLSPHVMRELMDAVRSRGLVTVLDRRVCGKAPSLNDVNFRMVAAALIFTLAFHPLASKLF